MRLKSYFLLSVLLLTLTSCAVKNHKNLPYLQDNYFLDGALPTLNVFTPRNSKTEKLPVLIFVHGGDWNSGNKQLYGFFGRNFAKKGVVSVIPDYTLSPKANYDTMTSQIAEAIRWVKKNITQYGGNPNNIFLTGHSAGGHLVALVTTNPKYGISPNTISGIILNDAAGLDMFHYLQQNPPTTSNNYLKTWSNNPKTWKKASPIYFLDENTPPIMIYLGSKSYPSIITGNKRFLNALKEFQPNVEPIILNKKHTPMILQYIWPWSDRYDEIMKFIHVNSNPSKL